jgi:hypothetical protein
VEVRLKISLEGVGNRSGHGHVRRARIALQEDCAGARCCRANRLQQQGPLIGIQDGFAQAGFCDFQSSEVYARHEKLEIKSTRLRETTLCKIGALLQLGDAAFFSISHYRQCHHFLTWFQWGTSVKNISELSAFAILAVSLSGLTSAANAQTMPPLTLSGPANGKTCSQLAAECTAYNRAGGYEVSVCAGYKASCMKTGTYTDKKRTVTDVAKR